MKKERGKMTKKRIKLEIVKDFYGDDDHETERLGFVHQGMFITEPDSSECGRFMVDPTQEYGLTKKEFDLIMKFNKIHDLSDKSIDFELGLTEQEQIEIERKKLG